MTPWLLVIVSLATWRLTSLLARERGPLSIGTHLRSMLGVDHDESGSPQIDAMGGLCYHVVTPWEGVDNILQEIAQGMTCMWCCSVWVAGLGLLLFQLDLLSWIMYTLAVSTVVIGLEKALT